MGNVGGTQELLGTGSAIRFEGQHITVYPTFLTNTDCHREVFEGTPGDAEDSPRKLHQIFGFYTGTMNSSIILSDLARFDQAPGPVTLSWAGGPLEQTDSHHFTCAVVDSLLPEVGQSKQYSTKHAPGFTGKSLHGMLRDLSFDWDDPMHRHQQHDHTTSSAAK